jgi:glycosyltransferase involved in cell wall biosynthesis
MGDQQTKGRPRLLLLAYYFPPVRAAACARTWSQAKYLARLGWDVIVVTPTSSVWRAPGVHPESAEAARSGAIRIIYTGHRYRFLHPSYLARQNSSQPSFFRRAGAWLTRWCLGLEAEAGWLSSAREACRLLTPDDVDVILASGGPFCTFALAQHLSRRLGCPYVLDYRDLWTQNPYTNRLSGRRQRAQERAALAGAAHVITVSEAMGEALHAAFGIGPNHTVIHNGYDPDVLADVRPVSFGHFAITYTGQFYLPKRPPGPVMAFLRRLDDLDGACGTGWRFHYYGPQSDVVAAAADRYGVSGRVVLHGDVPRCDALAAVAGAGVSVVVTSVAPKATAGDRGIVTGKVFEPLGLGVPVLLIAPPGSDAEAIVRSSACGQRFSGHEAAAIAQWLCDRVAGPISRPLVPTEYGWPSLSRRLDTVLRSVARSAGDGRAVTTWAPSSAAGPGRRAVGDD